MSLNTPPIVTLAILALAVGLFLSGRVRADVVALLVAALLGVSGVLTAEEAPLGFGSPATTSWSYTKRSRNDSRPRWSSLRPSSTGVSTVTHRAGPSRAPLSQRDAPRVGVS